MNSDKKYNRATMLQLLGLGKRLKAMSQMPALIAVADERRKQQDYYNNMIEYERLRNALESKIPPYMSNKENIKKVMTGLEKKLKK